jgi:predicted small secreted protein
MKVILIILTIIIICLIIYLRQDYSKNIDKPLNIDNYKFEKIMKYGSWKNMIKPTLNKDQLMKLSIIKEGKHIQDFIVNRDKTINVIFNKNSNIDLNFVELTFNNGINKIINLSKHDHDMLQSYENTFKFSDINCCPDGDPGTFWIITIHGKEPMNMYGSTQRNEAGRASEDFAKFCNNISKFFD